MFMFKVVSSQRQIARTSLGFCALKKIMPDRIYVIPHRCGFVTKLAEVKIILCNDLSEIYKSHVNECVRVVGDMRL